MEVTFKNEHHGMFLEKPVIFSPGINILCGKNGSGKTRFIEAITNQNTTKVSNENGIISPDTILYISAKSMLDINSGKQITQKLLDDTYRAIYGKYKAYLTKKDKIPNLSIENEASIQNYGVEFGKIRVADFIKKVAKNCNKNIESLTEADIKTERLPSDSTFSIQNEMSSLCATYMWLKKDHFYRRFLKDNDHDIYIYDFDEKHGRPPWVIINEILKDELDLNWYLEQSENLYDDISPVKFKSSFDESEINIQHLSDGEKTILWITCALIKHTLNRNSLEGCKLILLDEPDAFLHPKMIHCFISVVSKMSEELNVSVLMSTHSPTTVALAKECNIYNVTPKSITLVSQDSAIKDLLDGVNYIAVSPENRRTVYVEGYVDRLLYEILYASLHERNFLTPGLTIQFIEAAPRTDHSYLINKIKQHWQEAEHEDVLRLAEEINGQGACSSVKGQVSAFRSSDDSQVYGIIDRDKNNKPKNGLIVLCNTEFYAIDNVILNPIAILVLLYQEYSQENIFKKIFSHLSLSLIDIIEKKEDMNKALHALCEYIHPEVDKELKSISFIDGNSYQLPKLWIDYDGHDFEKYIKSKLPFLKGHQFKKEGKLKEHTARLICESHKSKYFPTSLLDTFNKIK